MSAFMSIECDCGVAETFTVPLSDGQTILGQHALGDFLLEQLDATHQCAPDEERAS